MENALLEAALGYLARGWRVFPLPSGSKKPFPRTHGVLEASGSPDQIEEWWRRWPDANIGIATGMQSGIIAIDIDPYNGGDESIIELQKRIGKLPNTPEVITGSGGRHLYFTCESYENEPRNATGLMKLPGLDIRGWHGYVLAPPSRTEKGVYQWDIGTEDLPFAPFPDALVVREEQKVAEPLAEIIPAGMRNDALMSLAGSMRRRGCTADEIFAGIQKVAQRCRPVPPDADVWTIAKNAARYDPATPTNQPIDEGAERDLVGACIIGSNEAMAKVLGLGITSDDLSTVLGQKAFSAMQSLHLVGGPIDIATVRSEADRLAGRSDGYLMDYLDECITKSPGSANYEQYTKSVLERSMRRRVLKVSSRLRTLAYAPATDREELVGNVAAQFDSLLRGAGSSKGMSAFDLALRHAHLLTLREQQDPSVVGYPTGYSSLDSVTAYRAGELWYVAARPSVGKTLALKELQMQLAKRGVPSLFISIEQPSVQLMDRNLASMSKVNSRSIQSGSMSEQEWDAVNRAVQDFSRFGNVLHIVDDESITTAKIDATVRMYVAEHGVKVVFVDYVQIVADEHGDSENDRVGYISGRLAEIARATATTIVAACQLSRQGAGVEPQLHHLRESGKLEQNAYVVLGMWRDPIDAPEINIRVLKNRNGENGMTFSLGYDPSTLRLREVVKVPFVTPTPVVTTPVVHEEVTQEPVQPSLIEGVPPLN